MKYRNYERVEKVNVLLVSTSSYFVSSSCLSLQLFQKSLIKVCNIDLWKCYLNYIKVNASECQKCSILIFVLFECRKLSITYHHSARKWVKHLTLPSTRWESTSTRTQYTMTMYIFLKTLTHKGIMLKIKKFPLFGECTNEES